MQFTVMMWVSEHAKSSSIFGVLDKSNPDKLPSISPKGHWEDFMTIDENRFKFAAEAKTAIAMHGFYLIGASVTLIEAFGKP
ncbi:MAG: hypothetical protein ACXWU5_03470 [Rhodoplanes sp.]|jgi:hypothetical protein|nr:hypothetical protein [Rhodoplanes sp.]